MKRSRSIEYVSGKNKKINMVCSVCSDLCSEFYLCQEDFCGKVFCMSCYERYDNILAAMCNSCCKFFCSDCIGQQTDDCTFFGCHDCYMAKHECQEHEKLYKIQ